MSDWIPGFHSDDYQPVPKSAREILSEKIHFQLKDWAFTVKDPELEPGKKFRQISFNCLGYCGFVKVYNSSYIKIELYAEENYSMILERVFDNEELALSFVDLYVLKNNKKDAESIPVRVKKERKKKDEKEEESGPNCNSKDLPISGDMFQ